MFQYLAMAVLSVALIFVAFNLSKTSPAAKRIGDGIGRLNVAMARR